MRGSMNLIKLRELLIKHEGWKEKAYQDSMGNTTIGVGRNLDGKGLSPGEIDWLLQNDIADATTDLCSIFLRFYDFSEDRQHALISMMFMGKNSFLTFTNMIRDINEGNWEGAAQEVLTSRYAVQVGTRAIEIAGMIRRG